MVFNLNDEKMIVLINVISVEPEHQQRTVDNVQEILEKYAKKQHGFVSADILKSFDGTRVTYLIRWRNQEDGLVWIERIHDILKIVESRIKTADYHLFELAKSINL